MRAISSIALVTLAAFVATSIMFAIAARRDRLNEVTRWISVMFIGAIGVAFAAALRLLTADLPTDARAVSLVAVVFAFGLAWFRFLRRPTSRPESATRCVRQ